ncbi:arginine repressor [Erwinia psidii]|uniref:Arginine repressor n=1 Tax=Erwinia psidii TaxID=69224 RepID=A0A3N6SII8_9GAMM|nr:ArgR family transcriptional regulator [Erwinia psidii]MCX8958505.1 ArgR family transcriptional regulator [Erwinia psidii]MCX8962008.1 ArgR family transcriptional regulator [Erwinia psidii]RQM37396.1 ArgR family transcriptional regulator [Erwinia psidii]
MVKKSRTTLEKEQQQLALCRQLITNHSFRSQQEIRLAFQQRGWPDISQSTISKLMTLLDVIKITNARGEKIYALNPAMQAKPDAISPLSAMVTDTDFNDKFVIVHVVAGYARAIARVIEHAELPEVLGIVATNNSIWIAPRNTRQTRQLHRRILRLLNPPADEETWPGMVAGSRITF